MDQVFVCERGNSVQAGFPNGCARRSRGGEARALRAPRRLIERDEESLVMV